MFQSLKEKISDTLWSLSSDDADKNLADLVARGTSETLIAPEWGVNMQLVDIVNQQPTVMPDKLLKVLKRSVGKPNAKTQILTLTILETCIKNCVPQLYDALAHSELWFELVKMAADTSIARVDADVRDKILCLVEDYAKVLPQPEFREAYEYLLEQGIDFPVRSPDEQAPILTPPTAYQPPTVLLSGAAPPAGTAAATAAAAGLAHAGARGGGGDAAAGEGADPFAGMSAEDRAAVQAAMAEMEEEERAVRESAALAASTALFQQMGQQQGAQQAPHAASGAQQQQQQRVAGQQGAGHAAPAPAADPGPVLPDNPEEALQVIANTTGLVNEMMASETDPREGFVVELAEQCVRFRSKLEDIINTLTDEAQLASALAHYEALQAAVTKYDEHLSRAEQGAALVQPAAGLASRPLQQPGEAEPFAVAAAAAAPAGYVAPSFLPPSGGSTAGPNFTLLDEDEEEDKGDALLSSKRAGAGAEPAPAPALAHTPAPAVAAAPAVVTPAPAANLIDLDLLAPSASPAPAPAAAPAAAAELLAAAPTPAVPASVATPSPVEQLDSLLDGLTVADLAPAPAPAPAPALAPAAAATPSPAPEGTQA